MRIEGPCEFDRVTIINAGERKITYDCFLRGSSATIKNLAGGRLLIKIPTIVPGPPLVVYLESGESIEFPRSGHERSTIFDEEEPR
jgi:hypothetical protein